MHILTFSRINQGTKPDHNCQRLTPTNDSGKRLHTERFSPKMGIATRSENILLCKKMEN